MKKISKILLMAAFFIFSNSLDAKSANSDEAMIQLEICRSKGVSSCYEDLFYKLDNSFVRLNYSVALMNEKRFTDVEYELNNIIRNSDNVSHVNYAKRLLADIEKRNEDMRVASYSDEGNYLNDIDVTSRWQNAKRIKVYIYSYSGKENLFEQAFSKWENSVSEIGFTYVDKISEADIKCYFVSRLQGNAAGVTEYPGGRRVIYGVNYVMPPVEIKVSQADPYGREFTDTELYSIILHEIGHALGINGHSKNKNDIMYYSTDSYKNTELSNRDKNTLKAIYH